METIQKELNNIVNARFVPLLTYGPPSHTKAKITDRLSQWSITPGCFYELVMPKTILREDVEFYLGLARQKAAEVKSSAA
jgi:hypothetical protein